MTKRRRGAKGRGRAKRRRASVRRSKIRVVHGRVAIKVAGFKQVQHIPASEIVRLIPVNKIKLAAKKILGKPKRSKKKVRRHRRAK